MPEKKKWTDQSYAKYDAENTVRWTLKVNLKTEADIYEALADYPNKQGRIKQLIRLGIQAEET